MKQPQSQIIALVCSVLVPLGGFAQETAPPKVALPEPVTTTTTVTTAPAPAGTAAAVPAAAPGTTAAPGQAIRLNFQGAALSDVLNYLSDAAGFVIVQEVPVTGTVNIVSRQPITPEDAVDLLNAVLIEKGYIALRTGRILKIVSRKDAQKRDLPVQSGSDPEKIPRKDEMVTQILPVRIGEAAKLVENLRPLLSDNASMTANEGSNTILMTDTLTNVNRVARIITAIDGTVTGITTIRVFQLAHADAKQLATIITQLFATSPSTSSRGGDRGRDFGFGGPPGFGDRGSRSQSSSTQNEARQAATRVVAVADEQSNTLVVTGPESVMADIKTIIDQIDTSIVAVAETRIFRLQHADAVELADILMGLFAEQTNSNNNQGRSRDDRRAFFGGFGGFGDRDRGRSQGDAQSARTLEQAKVVAIGDPRTNSLLVTASRDSMLGIAEMIGRLDATDAKKQRVFVHSLEHADAENVAAVLRGMFGDSSGTTGRAGTQTQSRLLERTNTGANADTPDIMNSGRAGGGGR
jgi:general secretion pathway protein D